MPEFESFFVMPEFAYHVLGVTKNGEHYLIPTIHGLHAPIVKLADAYPLTTYAVKQTELQARIIYITFVYPRYS